MALLTIVQQQAIKTISPNWAAAAKVVGGVNNFTQLESEIEENELKDLLGVALLQNLQEFPTEANNVLLLDGDSFTDCFDNTINTKGLRYVIAYMVHSQQITESTIGDTYSGYVEKNRQETQNASNGSKKSLKLRSQELALQEFELIKQYLNENSDTYTLWNCTNSKKPYIPRFTGIKKTIL